MKKILGLDLGTTSIGWAFIKEPEKGVAGSEIVEMGVRIVPLSSDEENDFAKGNTISINADRTLKRGARRNLQRFKQRRTRFCWTWHVLWWTRFYPPSLNKVRVMRSDHICTKHFPHISRVRKSG